MKTNIGTAHSSPFICTCFPQIIPPKHAQKNGVECTVPICNPTLQILQDIASWLGLPNADDFSGHSLCGTGATALANSGCTLLQLKRYGGWKSDRVAQRYLKKSIASQLQTSRALESAIVGTDIAFGQCSSRQVMFSSLSLSLSLSFHLLLSCDLSINRSSLRPRIPTAFWMKRRVSRHHR